MTTSTHTKPFLTRYAEPLSGARRTSHRYDEVRQVSQVLVDGVWVDASEARMAVERDTRMTKVHQETTDDD